eukprot:gene12139-13392_t
MQRCLSETTKRTKQRFRFKDSDSKIQIQRFRFKDSHKLSAVLSFFESRTKGFSVSEGEIDARDAILGALQIALMSVGRETVSKPAEQSMLTSFVSSGRTGRRNALGDIILEGQSSANTSALPNDLGSLSLSAVAEQKCQTQVQSTHQSSSTRN